MEFLINPMVSTIRGCTYTCDKFTGDICGNYIHCNVHCLGQCVPMCSTLCAVQYCSPRADEKR